MSDFKSEVTTPEAIVPDVKWIECKTCGGACEIEKDGEMIICPSCGGLGGRDTDD
ncbi:hypothetical protein ccbrp13_56500 [Ktedonobacteria bacterium brp13]|nr:hypothetical protein ccbrp13_56500 [Ktedonobacteria bacterium brp13]